MRFKLIFLNPTFKIEILCLKLYSKFNTINNVYLVSFFNVGLVTIFSMLLGKEEQGWSKYCTDVNTLKNLLNY